MPLGRKTTFLWPFFIIPIQIAQESHLLHSKLRGFSTEILQLGSSLPAATQRTDHPTFLLVSLVFQKKQGTFWLQRSKTSFATFQQQNLAVPLDNPSWRQNGFFLSRKPLKEEPSKHRDSRNTIAEETASYLCSKHMVCTVSIPAHSKPDSSPGHNINSTSEVQMTQPNSGEYRVTKGALPAKQNCTGTSLVMKCKTKIQLLQHWLRKLWMLCEADFIFRSIYS